MTSASPRVEFGFGLGQRTSKRWCRSHSQLAGVHLGSRPLGMTRTPAPEASYPYLVPRLQFSDLVRVRSGDHDHTEPGVFELQRTWSSGILDMALVRYTVWADVNGYVIGLGRYD